jgi:hypothetical protein
MNLIMKRMVNQWNAYPSAQVRAFTAAFPQVGGLKICKPSTIARPGQSGVECCRVFGKGPVSGQNYSTRTNPLLIDMIRRCAANSKLRKCRK